jgi:regulatory protein
MKKLSLPEAAKKIQHYCAYQERCHQEVRNKLYTYGLTSTEVNELITQLITSGFLNEERFAKAFAGGKFRMKKWGKTRIVHALEGKGLSANCIRIGLKEIDEQDYERTLQELLRDKNESIHEENIYQQRDKVAAFAIQKGYEPELVWTFIRGIIPDQR